MADKFGMGTLGISPLAGMLDSMEFVKQAWSTLNLPTNLAPTMDVEEMDRRIADLKVVEQWLTMNLGMLRNSIQGMEIQRGTLAAIHALGDAMSPSGDAGEAASRTIAAFGAMQRAATAAAGAAASPAATDGPADEPGAAPASTPPEPASDAGGAPKGEKRPPEPARGSAASLAQEISSAAASPSAWWNLLQSQFSQVAQAALAGAGIPVAPRGAAAPDNGASARKDAAARPVKAKRQSRGPGKPPKSKAPPARGKARSAVARGAVAGPDGSAATGAKTGVQAPGTAAGGRGRARGER